VAEQLWRREALATYATLPWQSRGRLNLEPEGPSRSPFQRDRDRIIHSTAFRRLKHKTQVFVYHEGDHYRTRLTHSLEVAQIARSVARSLHANEDLVEAIALAHDLGHTPFGHAGQDSLNDCMRQFGGFEHNLQSLRVVDELEERYGAFDGLNLCFETREGILKHCSPDNARKLGPVAERFLLRRQASLEAQIANLADEIAYNNHDVDDGLRSGLIVIAQLEAIPIVGPLLGAIPALLVAATISPQLIVAVAGVYLVLQLIEGNVLVPLVMRNTTGISPFLVILSVLIGGAAGGFLGALLAVPIAAAGEVLIEGLQARETPIAQDPTTAETTTDETNAPGDPDQVRSGPGEPGRAIGRTG